MSQTATPEKVAYLKARLNNGVADFVIERSLLKHQGDVERCFSELCHRPGPQENQFFRSTSAYVPGHPRGPQALDHPEPALSLRPSPVPRVRKRSGTESPLPSDKLVTLGHQPVAQDYPPSGSRPVYSKASAVSQPFLNSSSSGEYYRTPSPSCTPTGDPLRTPSKSQYHGKENTLLGQPQSYTSAVMAIIAKQQEQLQKIVQHHGALLNRRSQMQRDAKAKEEDLHRLRHTNSTFSLPSNEEIDFTKIVIQTLRDDIFSEEQRLLSARRQSSNWECGECRFVNHPALPRCESCNSLREHANLQVFSAVP